MNPLGAYRRFGSRFWTGPTGKQIQAAGDDALVVAVYVFTSPHSNMLGLYRCPAAFIAHETGRTEARVVKALAALARIGFACYDADTETVYVPEMLRFQVLEGQKAPSPHDNRLKAVQRNYTELHTNPFLPDFAERYGGAFDLPKRTLEGAPKPLASPSEGGQGGSDHAQAQAQAQAQDLLSPSGGPGPMPLLLGIWNRETAGVLPSARTVSPKSKRADVIAEALRACPDLDRWAAAFRAIAASPHHRGDNDRGWKADLDFTLRKDQRDKWLDAGEQGNAQGGSAIDAARREVFGR